MQFYVCVSVHHKSILYKEPTRCNFGIIVISNCKITLHVSDASLGRPYSIYLIPTHEMQQWLLLQFMYS